MHEGRWIDLGRGWDFVCMVFLRYSGMCFVYLWGENSLHIWGLHRQWCLCFGLDSIEGFLQCRWVLVYCLSMFVEWWGVLVCRWWVPIRRCIVGWFLLLGGGRLFVFLWVFHWIRGELHCGIVWWWVGFHSLWYGILLLSRLLWRLFLRILLLLLVLWLVFVYRVIGVEKNDPSNWC